MGTRWAPTIVTKRSCGAPVSGVTFMSVSLGPPWYGSRPIKLHNKGT